MTATPIADNWTEIERAAGIVFSDNQRDVLRAMYFAGAMAALHHMTGFDPVNGYDVLTVNRRVMEAMCLELTLAYFGTEDMLRRAEH